MKYEVKLNRNMGIGNSLHYW